MTNLSLNNPQEFLQAEKEVQIVNNPFLNFYRALVSTNSNTGKKVNFIDAWLLSSNGQG